MICTEYLEAPRKAKGGASLALWAELLVDEGGERRVFFWGECDVNGKEVA